jgi:hypothetical protein
LGKAYTDAYGVKATTRDLSRYSVLISNSPIPEPAPVEEAATASPPPTVTEPNQFVPDALMTHGLPIKESVIQVGGKELALRLGRIIEEVGGMANFERAVAFLETIQAFPTRPQIAPIDNGAHKV